jgi:hypothetical protein
MKDGALHGVGYAVVPLWEEGQAGARVVPRYKVVTLEESFVPPAPPGGNEDAPAVLDPGRLATVRNGHRRRQRSRELQIGLEATLLFPFRCWRSIILLSLLLSVSVGVALTMLAKPEPDSLAMRWALALVQTLLVVGYCCGYWMAAFATTIRGEDFVVVWRGWLTREVLVNMLRCLACFFAGPVWILALAACYWLYSGELTWVDTLILSELIIAALTYWMFALLAVTADNSVRSLTPTGIGGLLRRLGRRVSLLAAGVALIGIVPVCGLSAGALAAFSESGNWLLVPIISLGSQVFLALFVRWLGVECFLADRVRNVQQKMQLGVEH